MSSSSSWATNPLLVPALFVTGVIIYGTQNVLNQLSRDDAVFMGEIPFTIGSVIFVSELVKLGIAGTLYMREKEGNVAAAVAEFRGLSGLEALYFAVPGFLYMITNNLSMEAVKYMDSATVQVLSNLKVLTTAVLFRIIMKKKQNGQQWFSLVVLLVGSLMITAGGQDDDDETAAPAAAGDDDAADAAADNAELAGGGHQAVGQVSLYGLMLVLIFCALSGFAGIYTEYVIKRTRLRLMSLNFQNIQMYTYGLLWNGMLYIKSPHPLGLFGGWNAWTLLLVVNQSSMGLVVSMIMKYSNNITKLFVNGLSMFLSTALTCYIWRLSLSASFAVALVLVSAALYMYNTPQRPIFAQLEAALCPDASGGDLMGGLGKKGRNAGGAAGAGGASAAERARLLEEAGSGGDPADDPDALP